MSVSAYIHRQLVDLLEERRVVVWYDPEKTLRDLAADFRATNCILVDTSNSILKARREADQVFRGIDNMDHPELKHKNLLIYFPRRRGLTEDERFQDPFEVFAVVGAAFGDKEGETLHSLGRQAMPDRTSEIDRLFAEGRPTLAMLDNLKAGDSYPILNDCLGTDSPLDVAAQVLCLTATGAKVADAPGAIDELLRMLAKEYGYAPPARVSKIESKLEPFGPFILLSEFTFDRGEAMPDALASQSLAKEDHRERIYALCDRLRKNDDLRDGYIELAQRVESQLRLPEVFKDSDKLGERDTFPFEERHYLSRLQPLVAAGKLDDAREIITARRQSVWSTLGDRFVLWRVAERCLEFLVAVETSWPHRVAASQRVQDHVAAYVDKDLGFWRIDLHQRLFEQGIADCAENDEIEPLIELCRRRYREVVSDTQDHFLQAVQREGWPPDGLGRQTQTFDRHVAPVLQSGGRVAYFLVDAMRYEMGRELGKALGDSAPVRVEAVASTLPAITPFGMAALMPGADGTLRIVQKGQDLVPSIGDQVLAGLKERLDLLKSRYGDRFAEMTLEQVLSIKTKKPPKAIAEADLIVVRTQEIDAFGETTNLHQARKHMSGILGELVTAANRLAKLGFSTFVFAADHGHVLLPEVAAGDVVSKPPGEWLLEKRRCLLGQSTASSPGVLLLKADKMGLDVPVPELAIPTEFRVFRAGAGYFHEGVSIQECVVPVVVVNISKPAATESVGTTVAIRYRSDRFTSRVIGLKVFFNSMLEDRIQIRLDAFDGSGPKATMVGEAVDCDARDPATGLITLKRGVETQVPVKLVDEYEGRAIEVRAIEAKGLGVVLARLELKNAVMT
jgi:hypothetical protein